jgi:elongation factor P--(R)-beta-lysine ligase
MIDWRPTVSLDALRLRARVLSGIRAFFAERGVLEVETPYLSAAAVTDVHLGSIPAEVAGRRMYLQTSPEYAMKRLLAAGAGPIYQLARAFRDGEAGRRHNPEFTLLEWYRPGWDHHRLMGEVEDFLRAVLPAEMLTDEPAERLTYREAFRTHAGVDPFESPVAQLAEAARARGGSPPDLGDDRDAWLDLLMGTVVERALGRGRPTFVHDFPASQAALAKIRDDGPTSSGHPVAERFELFVQGVELANGFHELTDPHEQRQRFQHDLALRRQRNLPQPPLDERFLAALEAGLPESAGVALGVDRLLMLAAGTDSIRDVLAFPIDRA